MKLAIATALASLASADFSSPGLEVPEVIHNGSSVVLSNGATLRAEIFEPLVNSTYIASKNTTDVSLLGMASVEKGKPDVTYIYVIDNSGSTASEDGACGTILECMQKFLFKLHKEAVSDGSASLAGVINFDDNVYVSADLQPVSNVTGIQNAIFAGEASGENYCQDALNAAAKLVKDPKNTARTSVVVFVGDGECSTCGKGCPIDTDYALPATGAIVHSVAIGDNVECTGSLKDIPANGGRCTSVPDPNTLVNIVDDLVGSDLQEVEFRVDDRDYVSIPSGSSVITGKTLPAEAPAHAALNVTLPLPVGSHKVCIRVTGDDSLGGSDVVEDCAEFFVMTEPVVASDSNATAIALGTLGALLAALVIGLWTYRRCTTGKEDVEDEGELAANPPKVNHPVV